VNRDADKRPDPWQPAHFMPGAKSEEDEMREFAEAVMRGDKFEADPDEIDRFKRQMQDTFGQHTDQASGIIVGNLVQQLKPEIFIQEESQ
jgi:hypothetical protein